MTAAYGGFGGSFVLGGTYLMSQGVYEVPAIRYAAIAALTNTTPMVPSAAPGGRGRRAGRAADRRRRGRNSGWRRRRSGGATWSRRTPSRTAPARVRGTTSATSTSRCARRCGSPTSTACAPSSTGDEAGEPRLLGIGLSTYVEITGFGGTEFGSVEIHEDGSATVVAGTSAHGQGHATAFAMIVSDRLRIPMDQISFVQSDTARVRSGGGTGGSRSLQLGGSAVGGAADEVLERAREVAAEMLEASAADVEVVDGGLGVRGTGATVTWAEVAGRAGGLTGTHDFTSHGATYPTPTSRSSRSTPRPGTSPRCGTSPSTTAGPCSTLLVEGQQHGGALQGHLAGALGAHAVRRGGHPVTASFVDYAIPTSADAIALEVSTTDADPLNPLGPRGSGVGDDRRHTGGPERRRRRTEPPRGPPHRPAVHPRRVWRAVEQARAAPCPISGASRPRPSTGSPRTRRGPRSPRVRRCEPRRSVTQTSFLDSGRARRS